MNTINKRTKKEQLKALKNKTKVVYKKCCENINKFSIGYFESMVLTK